MDKLSQKDLQVHIPILGWILIATHAFGLVIAILVFFLLTGIGAAVGDSIAFGVLSITGTTVGLFIAALSLPGVLAGYGLLTQKSWGRLAALVVLILGLLNFPIGTVIGVYGLWVLLQEESRYYFAA
jgi:hypothetical protein